METNKCKPSAKWLKQFSNEFDVFNSRKTIHGLGEYSTSQAEHSPKGFWAIENFIDC